MAKSLTAFVNDSEIRVYSKSPNSDKYFLFAHHNALSTNCFLRTAVISLLCHNICWFRPKERFCFLHQYNTSQRNLLYLMLFTTAAFRDLHVHAVLVISTGNKNEIIIAKCDNDRKKDEKSWNREIIVSNIYKIEKKYIKYRYRWNGGRF